MFEDEDDIIDALAKAVAKDESGVFVVDPEKVEAFAEVYRTVSTVAKGQGVRMEYAIGKPFPSMGYVSLTGKDIEVTDPALFAKAARLASNVEVYTLNNGKTKIDFTFHGLTVKAGGTNESV